MPIPVGVDVGARELVVAYRDGSSVRRRKFSNNQGGHAALIEWLPQGPLRVVVEATGFYSLDVCIALHRRRDIEVMVANPRAVANFAKAMMARGKTDDVDAEVLMEFAERMPFTRWLPPSQTAMDLRSITRRLRSLVKLQTMEKNRLKSARASAHSPTAVLEDLEDSIEQYDDRIERLTKKAIVLIESDPPLSRKFDLLQTIPGVGKTSAVKLLGELAALPADMNVKQWVAHAGLDPRPWKSGTSIDMPPRVTKAGNKYIRNALFLPALVAVQHDAKVRDFYDRLVQVRRKRPLQATVAVMRKLLHAIFGMFKADQEFKSSRFCPDAGDAQRPPHQQKAGASEARPASDGPPAQAGAAGAEGVARPGRSEGATARPPRKRSARRTVAVERGATGSSPGT